MRSLWLLVLAILLFFAFRNTPLTDIWNTLKGLHPEQIAIILTVNAIVILLITLRWWIIVRAENPSVPFLPLIGYRLSVFGLSYFTPGPQVGGEPLQVLYLQRRHGLTYARATSTVIMDKLVEFLGNAILIGVGVLTIIKVGVISNNGDSFILSLIGLAVLMMWPIVHIILLYKGRYPFSRFLRGLPFIPQGNNTVRLIIISERMAAAFCRTHMRFLVASGMASILSISGMVFEYFLMVTFLGMKLNGLQVFAGFTAMQISFLFPLPAGLGALEASQVLVLGAFGQPATMAVSLTLLMRGRDLLNGGLGLLLAGRGISK